MKKLFLLVCFLTVCLCDMKAQTLKYYTEIIQLRPNRYDAIASVYMYDYQSFFYDLYIPYYYKADRNYRVTSVAKRGFEDCTNMRSVDMPESIVEIKERGFMGCVSLPYVKIPSNVHTGGGTICFRRLLSSDLYNI